MFNPNVVVKISWRNQSADSFISLVARLLIAYIFLAAGWGKLPVMQQLQDIWKQWVFRGLLPLVILVEFGGGLALLFGFQARFAAFGLGIFSILTAFLFHQGGADAAAQYNNGIHFMKNLAMAGGLFFLMLHGAGRISLDHAIEK